MKKYIPTILIAIAILFVVVFIARALMAPDSSQIGSTSSDLSQENKDALKTGATIGDPNSKVVVTEFGDYQCPACAAWHTFVKDTMLPKYQDKILFVFKNFPLPIHKNAKAGAYAVEAAGLQGKFWEMHNIVYENQSEWENESNPNGKFEEYANRVGLNIDQWKKDIESSKIKDLVEKDTKLGEKLNLPGTPSFLVNGVLVQTKSEADLTQAIGQALAQ
jgi:protein-disulfide isomerase